MRKLLITVAAVLLMPAGAAFAGCANYVDGSLNEPAPRATICFSGKCEKVSIVSECGNVFGTQVEYSNGWHVEYGDATSTKEGDDTIKIYRELKPSEFSKVTCKNIDEDACRFPDKAKP